MVQKARKHLHGKGIHPHRKKPRTILTAVMCRISVLYYLKGFFREIVKGRMDYEKLLPMTIGINNNKL